MWDKKIDSPLQSKIPETFFNSLLNGKSDPLGNFLKTSLLDRVICQITQEWSLQKLFSKCNTALQWDFFPGFGELKELYMSATPLCYCPSNKMVFRFLCWELHASCLPANTKHCRGKSVLFLGFLTTGCQQGVWGAGGPGETLTPHPGEQNKQAVMGMGGPASKEKLQTQPSCSRNELSFPDEDSRPRAFLRSSFLQSSAVAVHKFNLQFPSWQELQEHLACGCKHTARGVWVTTGGQGAAGTLSRGGFGAGPGS